MNQKGFVNIILIVVIVILAGAVGYFVLVRKSAPVVQQSPTPTPASTKTANPSPTSSEQWKQYQNIRNYSLKYPADWQLKESAQIVWIRDSSQNALFKVNVFPNYDDKDNDVQKVREYVTSLERFTCDPNDEGPCSEIEAATKKADGWQVQGSKEITLDNMKGMSYGYKKISGTGFSELYYIPKQGGMYEIELTDLASTNQSSLNPVLMKILDTFQFPR